MIDKMKVYQDTELSSKAVSVYLYLCERASKETKSCYPYLKISGKELYLSQVSLRCFISKFEKKLIYQNNVFCKKNENNLWMDL